MNVNGTIHNFELEDGSDSSERSDETPEDDSWEETEDVSAYSKRELRKELKQIVYRRKVL